MRWVLDDVVPVGEAAALVRLHYVSQKVVDAFAFGFGNNFGRTRASIDACADGVLVSAVLDKFVRESLPTLEHERSLDSACSEKARQRRR